jgi:hypothetical protein
VRSAARTPRPALPGPRSRAPAQDQTGHAAADPRRISRAGTRCSFDQRAQEGPQQPPRVLQILPGPGPRWKPPGRAQRVQGAPCAAAGALDHGHPAQDQTGHAAADPRRISRAGTRCSFDQRAQEGPQQPRRVLPILPALPTLEAARCML